MMNLEPLNDSEEINVEVEQAFMQRYDGEIKMNREQLAQ